MIQGIFVICALLSAAISSEINAQFLLPGYSSDTKVNFKLDPEKKTYSYDFRSPDRTSKYEEGHFETDPATGEESLVVQGGYEYIGNDGSNYIVMYTADKNGYHPKVVIIPSSAEGISYRGFPQAAEPTSGGKKGIDFALMCSLIGSGCK